MVFWIKFNGEKAIENEEIYLFKTTFNINSGKEVVELTALRALENHQNYIETDIYFDLNIISHIRKFMENEQIFDKEINIVNLNEPIDSSLLRTQKIIKEVLTKIRSLPGVFISSGGAFFESHENFRVKNYESYEMFLQKYAPRFVNSYDNIDSLENIKNSENFYRLKVGYLNILLIQYINIVYENFSPMEKFLLYLEKFDKYVVPIDGLGSLVAKFAFWGRENLQGDERCFLDNFLKRSNSKDKLFSNSLNAAQDLHHFFIVAFLDCQKVMRTSDVKKDTWLMTADKGLYLLSKYTLYLDKGKGGMAVFLESMSFDLRNFVQSCSSLEMEFSRKNKVSKIRSSYHEDSANQMFLKNMCVFQKKLEGAFNDSMFSSDINKLKQQF